VTAEVRLRVLAVLMGHRQLACALTGTQIDELADALMRALAYPADEALRAELARSTGSGWTGRWAA
jgi:hypothetical protein